jgi:hypothetical protein
MALVLDATGLPMPGLRAADLGVLPQLILIGTYILAVLMGYQRYENKKEPGFRLVVAYAILLVILMAVRGSGLRILGSTTWGGQQYIVQFIAIFMFFILPNIKLERKHIRWIAWGCLLAGLMGSLIALKRGDLRPDMAKSEVVEARQSWVTAFYAAFLPIVYAFKAKKIRLLNIAMLAVLLILVLVSGFRGRLVTFGAVLFIYGLFKARNKIGFVACMGLLGLVAWIAVLLITPSMPLAVQRALSIVPGAQVTAAVEQSAQSSSDWRVELWKYALTQAPHYFLVGRGMTIDVMDVLAQGGVTDFFGVNTWFYFQTHAYHSGPIALLIDLGIPGTIIYVLFSVVVWQTMGRYAKQLAKMDTFESRFALFNCVFVIWSFIGFYLIFGGIARIGEQILQYALAVVYAKSVLRIYNEEQDAKILAASVETEDGGGV